TAPGYGFVEFMEVGAGYRFNGGKKTVFRKTDAFAGVIVREVAHNVIEAFPVFRSSADFDIEEQPDELTLGVVGDGVVVRVVAPQPGVPAGFLRAHQTAPRRVFHGIDNSAQPGEVLDRHIDTGAFEYQVT